MKEEAESVMKEIYRNHPQVLKRLKYLGNPDTNFNWTLIEQYEADLMKQEELKKSRTSLNDLYILRKQDAIKRWSQHQNDTG
jgi:hypothetical protein